MWLRNYDNMFCSMFGAGAYNGGGAWSTNGFVDGSFAVKAWNGTVFQMQNYMNPSSGNSSSTSGYSFANFSCALTCFDTYLSPTNVSYNGVYPKSIICVGSGNTPATYDDYKLESQLSSSQLSHINYITTTLGYDDEKKAWGKRVTRQFRNISSSQITISEIGIYGYHGYGSNTTYHVLMYREVLDTPIVVEPDQKFEVSIDMYAQMLHHPDLA